ncbi:MAG: MATE family efflux transporter [Lactobacillales bacterium]|jgi:putative MATE family efflux protein|nr:MATE family efflux transporter [Lactobacillales bacterium]
MINLLKRTTKDKASDKEVFKLGWPILLEYLIKVGCTSANVFMVAYFGGQAVAAVGCVNQLVSVSMFLYGFATVGAQILIAQYIGAKLNDKIENIVMTAFLSSALIGLAITLLMFFVANPILTIMQLKPDVIHFGVPYLQMSGIATVFNAISGVSIAVLRSFMHTRHSLKIPMTTFIIELVLNIIVILFLPKLGMFGIGANYAIASLISMFVGFYLLEKHTDFTIRRFSLKRIELPILKKIFLYGIPSSGEPLSYTASQLVVTIIVAMLGTKALIAKNYVQAIVQFTCLIALAIAQSSQIIIARNVGARRFNFVHRRGLRSLIQAIFASFAVALLIWAFGGHILGLLTDDSYVIKLARIILFVEIFLEIGRAACMMMVNALNASGDVKYPVTISLITVWALSLPLSFLFSIPLHLGLVGVWLAYTTDECVRGFFLVRRWLSGIWREKSIVTRRHR